MGEGAAVGGNAEGSWWVVLRGPRGQSGGSGRGQTNLFKPKGPNGGTLRGSLGGHKNQDSLSVSAGVFFLCVA